MARPTIYSAKLSAKICSLMAEGLSLRTICSEDSMPDKSNVFRWLVEKPAFRDQYVLAQDTRADALAEEILDIADDGTNDWVMKQNKDGSEYVALNPEHVQRSRLRVDARKWIASKLKPKKYGENSTVDLNVNDALAQRIAAARKRNAKD